MGKADASLEPQQERSRESLRKLLKAATEVLGQRGVEGTTVPRIAQHAGLTPGAIYRRFRDKDALIEAAILGILERQDQRLKAGLSPTTAAKIPLDVFVEQIVGGMVVSYRANAALLRALRKFAHARAETEFAKEGRQAGDSVVRARRRSRPGPPEGYPSSQSPLGGLVRAGDGRQYADRGRCDADPPEGVEGPRAERRSGAQARAHTGVPELPRCGGLRVAPPCASTAREESSRWRPRTGTP